MAITEAYATVEEYLAAYQGHDTGGLDSDLQAISDFITSYTHQDFGIDAVVVARPWPGDGTNKLKVYGQNNCAGIATATGLLVAIDRNRVGNFDDPASAVASGDYELRPLNAALGREPEPYREIVLHHMGTYTDGSWPAGGRVQVTARYGWPAVPASIRRACVALTAIWRIEGPRATGRVLEDMNTTFATSYRAQSIVNELLSPYREWVFA